MRTLIISDIHSNFEALRAVTAIPHDSVICLGDIVGYGLDPARCVDWVRDNADVVVQGNHDRAVGSGVDPRCSPAFRELAQATLPWQTTQLDDDARQWLTMLPRWGAFELPGRRAVAVHATPTDPLYRYLGPDPLAWALEIQAVGADLLLVGHTHLPFDLGLPGGRVVNPGSVGQPKDGTPGACYAVIADGHVRLGRVPYDLGDIAGRYQRAGVNAFAARRLVALLQTGRPDLNDRPADAAAGVGGATAADR